jgi:hypothetical protein
VALVNLVLAYAAGKPEGDVADRLELRVGLTPLGHIDEQAYYADPESWPSLRVMPEGAEYPGEVVLEEGGWALRSARSDDAPLCVMVGKVFRPGELVTLRRPDGEDLIFRVVNVEAG